MTKIDQWSELGSKKVRPFLKSAGGKTQLLPQLRAMVPKKFVRYWEPFLGGGALYFDLQPQLATLSDLNYRWVRAFVGVQKKVEKTIVALAEMRNTEARFYAARKSPPKTLHGQDPLPWEWAAWVIYMNKTCFNGLWRENSKGEFNAPWGHNENKMVHLDEENLRAASRALKTAELYAGDFADIRPLKGDFVYFDPPYAPLTATSNFTTYVKGGFGVADHVRLRDFALDLKHRGVHVLISNSSGPLVRGLYDTKHFEVTEVNARRAINSKAEKRGNVKELLIR